MNTWDSNVTILLYKYILMGISIYLILDTPLLDYILVFEIDIVDIVILTTVATLVLYLLIQFIVDSLSTFWWNKKALVIMIIVCIIMTALFLELELLGTVMYKLNRLVHDRDAVRIFGHYPDFMLYEIFWSVCQTGDIDSIFYFENKCAWVLKIILIHIYITGAYIFIITTVWDLWYIIKLAVNKQDNKDVNFW